jgi:hypothetical protein
VFNEFPGSFQVDFRDGESHEHEGTRSRRTYECSNAEAEEEGLQKELCDKTEDGIEEVLNTRGPEADRINAAIKEQRRRVVVCRWSCLSRRKTV